MPTSEVKIHTFYYQFYCNDCKKIFSIPVQKNEEEIPEKHRVRFLELLAEGKRLIWPFDESPSEEKVRKMERETVHCPDGGRHLIQFVWKTGTGSD